MEEKIIINIESLVGKVEITVHPCDLSNQPGGRLEKQLENLQSKVVKALLQSVETAAKSLKEALVENKLKEEQEFKTKLKTVLTELLNQSKDNR